MQSRDRLARLRTRMARGEGGGENEIVRVVAADTRARDRQDHRRDGRARAREREREGWVRRKREKEREIPCRGSGQFKDTARTSSTRIKAVGTGARARLRFGPLASGAPKISSRDRRPCSRLQGFFPFASESRRAAFRVFMNFRFAET